MTDVWYKCDLIFGFTFKYLILLVNTFIKLIKFVCLQFSTFTTRFTCRVSVSCCVYVKCHANLHSIKCNNRKMDVIDNITDKLFLYLEITNQNNYVVHELHWDTDMSHISLFGMSQGSVLYYDLCFILFLMHCD